MERESSSIPGDISVCTNPRRRQRWVNVRFGLKPQAGFRIGGNASLSFHRLTLLTTPIQSGVPGALNYP